MKIPAPIGDKVVVTEPPQTANKAGIELAPGSKERPLMGVIFAVGPDVKSVKVDDEIAFSRFGHNDVKIDGVVYYILEEKQILARIVEA